MFKKRKAKRVDELPNIVENSGNVIRFPTMLTHFKTSNKPNEIEKNKLFKKKRKKEKLEYKIAY